MRQEFRLRAQAIFEEYSNQRFCMRFLQEGDYEKGFFNLLEQFQEASPVDEESFKRQVRELERKDIPQVVVVVEDLQLGKVAAQGTLMIQQRFIRQLGRVGQISDIVVDRFYRKNYLGLIVVQALQRIAFQADNCYKVMINPLTKNISYYKKLNFKVVENHMVLFSAQFENKQIKAKL